MVDFFNNFHFLRPYFLFFFLLPFFFSLKNVRLGHKESSWKNICDKNLLNFQIIRFADNQRRFLKNIFYVGLFTSVISAAGPAWIKTEVPQITIENPSMFVLSLADNMQLRDVTPSRLDRAKFMISDITESLPEGQYGLIVYSSEPYLITPITEDPVIIKNLLQQINLNIVPDNGDRLDRAINLAVDRLKAANYTNGNILLLTSDVNQKFNSVLKEVEKAKSNHYNIHVIDTSFNGSEKLRLIAQSSGGIYLNVKEQAPQVLIQELMAKNKEKNRVSENLHSDYLDYGYFLAFIPLFCLLFFFRRGLLIFLLFFALSPSANASFLLNSNQEALHLFKQQEYDKALEKFQDNIWKGIVLYKQNKTDEALKEFSKIKNDISFYNSGVILAKECKYTEALEAFNEAIKLNPKNGDALYNKKVLEDLFEKSKEDPDILHCCSSSQKTSATSNDSDDSQNDDSSQNESSQSEQNATSDNNKDSQAEDNTQNQDSNEEKSNNDNSSENNSDKSDTSSQDNSATEQQNSETTDNSESDDNSQPSKNDESQQKNNNQSEKQSNQGNSSEKEKISDNESSNENSSDNESSDSENKQETSSNHEGDNQQNSVPQKNNIQNQDSNEKESNKDNSLENNSDKSDTSSQNNSISEQQKSETNDNSGSDDNSQPSKNDESQQKNNNQSEKQSNQDDNSEKEKTSDNESCNENGSEKNKEKSNRSQEQNVEKLSQPKSLDDTNNKETDNIDDLNKSNKNRQSDDNNDKKEEPSSSQGNSLNQNNSFDLNSTNAKEKTELFEDFQPGKLHQTDNKCNSPVYDEETLAIQRRYREIPEDVGGLLREFIKKEYLKDRYHD